MSTLQATTAASLIGDWLRQADHLTWAGRIHEAETILNRAWQSSRDPRVESCRAMCCRRLGMLHRLSGQRDVAARFRQLALTAELREQGRPSGISLWLAACEARERGDDEDAEKLLAASVVSAQPARLADVLAERGRLCRARRDWPGAIALLQRSVRLMIRANDRFLAARVLEELGGVCLEDQRFRMAAQALDRAAGLFQRMDRDEDARRSLRAARESDARRRVLETAVERN